MMPVHSKDFLSLGNEYKIMFGDKQLTLGKGTLFLGHKLPDITGLVTPEMTSPYFISGKRKLILTVPSVDTPVCEYQIKEMNEKIDSYYDKTGRDVYVISVDTPFAQARFIRDNRISGRFNFLSAYANHGFLKASGLHILELNLFARSAILCDEIDTVTNIYVTKDITNIPSFDFE
ncbi:redoxin domain-containing protein [Salmonella enterica subsp. enterica serovar Typhimurium]|nr:redoxin domain-containing protein [Salmonella enterica subsp. enterica serovar Typhimurium]